LLACLAPFSSVINRQPLRHYMEQLRQQPVLAHLPCERLPEVLQEASNWGLVSPHPDMPGFLRLQPIFPYFLRNRLHTEKETGTRTAVETAFRQYYYRLCGTINELCESQEAQKRLLGLSLIDLEYENMVTALFLALQAHSSIITPLACLFHYLDATKDNRRALELGKTVREGLEGLHAYNLSGQFGVELIAVLGDIATYHLELGQYVEARAIYQKALEFTSQLKSIDEDSRNTMESHLYHQLGRVAHEQFQWAAVEQFYQQALHAFIKSGDRKEQAVVFHSLGRVAQEQRQWEQARRYYNSALRLYTTLKDRYRQANIYHNRGTLALEQRQWARAKRDYQRALQIFSDLGDEVGEIKGHGQLGWVAQGRGQLEQARNHFLKALEMAAQTKDGYGLEAALYCLGQVWAEADHAGLATVVARILSISLKHAEDILRRFRKGPAIDPSQP
jgi:tetratricopeptide (TPR) repeat protein